VDRRSVGRPARGGKRARLPVAPCRFLRLGRRLLLVEPFILGIAILALFAPGSGLESLAVDAFVARLVRN
jgi:hypothetical protein